MKTGYDAMKDYLEPMKIEFVKMQEGENVKIRLLPDSPVMNFRRHFAPCPCCQKEGAKGHERTRIMVKDIVDGKNKFWEFGPHIKKELFSVIQTRYSCAVVRIGEVTMFLINSVPHIDIIVEKFHDSKLFPQYRVRQI